MSTSLQDLFTHNRAWAAQIERDRPGFFTGLVKQQTPKYMWIGCSDSRVPANQITGLDPGEVFVHRNVANIVVHSDLNALSAIQFAVEMLKVEHIMVVGHYGCGGVHAVLQDQRIGLADNWLRHVGDVMQKHEEALIALDLPGARHARLCELNVVEQVFNLCQTTVVQDAWQRSQPLAVHGWCYGLSDGRIRELGMDVSQPGDLLPVYGRTLEHLAGLPVT